MAMQTFDFEKPIVDIQQQIDALREEAAAEGGEPEGVATLEKERDTLAEKLYGSLTAWQRVQIARHMDRPRSLDFIEGLLTEWQEIKGDRGYRDDPAVVCGLARLGGEPVAIIGQQKGSDTTSNVHRNFGMMHPEGYRKALRLMRLAERFGLPIIVLIDTPGAYPGIGAEERGQSEAIAFNIMEMFTIRTPIVGVVIGEGASGGALGVGVVDHMMMLENSWYCVISPEGCASILWRDAAKAPEVAEILKLTPDHLLEQEIVDAVVPEPQGGAHRDSQVAIENLRKPLVEQIKALQAKDTDTLLQERYEKYRKIGVVAE